MKKRPQPQLFYGNYPKRLSEQYKEAARRGIALCREALHNATHRENNMTQFVVVLELDEALMDGDDSIEVACRLANEALEHIEGTVPATVRPLSEIIAC